MIKKAIPLIVALLMSTTCLVVSADEEAKSLRLVTHVFPPFQYKDNGVIKGSMIDVMQAICHKVGVPCSITMASFQDALNLATTGAADVLFTVTLSDDNTEKDTRFYLSPYIVETRFSFFVESQSDWTWRGDPVSLKNATIISFVPATTSVVANKVANHSAGATVVHTSSNLAAFQKLILGGDKTQNSVVVANKDVGLFLLKSQTIIGPKLAGDIGVSYLGFMFSRNSKYEGLAKEFMQAAESLKKDGTIGKLLGKGEYPSLPAP